MNLSYVSPNVSFADWWKESESDLLIVDKNQHDLELCWEIKNLAELAFLGGIHAQYNWQELVAGKCEHEFRYGGIKYQEHPTITERYDHYDWYYCTRCLEITGQFLYSSTSIASSAFAMPSGASFEQGPPELP